ncbi:MAG: hypothetical protein ABF553_01170 [Acetobacter orientalis]|uniref:hypothetical protein n=1 Tax=Acetobacter orientalis TaxID=146474 RepID=UPI0039E76D19
MSVRTQFPEQTLKTLFDAILVNDVAETEVTLPTVIPSDFSAEQVAECFALCRQLWLEGISYTQFLDLAWKIMRNQDLSEVDRVAFKHIRAKYKHMGFGFILYTPQHKRPFLYEATSTLMGEVQDAFRNGLRKKVFLFGVALRLLASKFFQKKRERMVRQAQLDTTANFNAYLKNEIAKIPDYLNQPAVTSAQFHALRKIISRHISFFDTLRTLYPTETYNQMSRFLSAINGLMGRMHDELIAQSVAGTLDYHKDKIEIPERIRAMLNELYNNYSKNI